MSIWRIMFICEHYGRTRLKLSEVAEQIGMAEQTIKNRRTKGEFAWIKADGRDLYADVSDVVAYLESRRTSREETPA